MYHRGEAVDKAYEKFADKTTEHVDLEHYHIVPMHHFNETSLTEADEHDGHMAPPGMKIVTGHHEDGTGPHVQGIKFHPAHHNEAAVERFAKTLTVRHPENKHAILSESDPDNMGGGGKHAS